MTCVAVYILLMSFAQKGIDRLRNYYEHMQMRDPDGELEMSEGFDEGQAAGSHQSSMILTRSS